MMELTIKEKVYQFNFNMGFLREVNKKYQKPIDGVPNAKENVGLQMIIAGVNAGDCEFLAEVLHAANIGMTPRATMKEIEQYIDECEDIDKLFDDVIEGLKSANATKKITLKMLAEIAEAEARQKANA